MPAFEAPHITTERTSEIGYGEDLTVLETAHLVTCPECQGYIEKEKHLIKVIADIHRREKDQAAD